MAASGVTKRKYHHSDLVNAQISGRKQFEDASTEDQSERDAPLSRKYMGIVAIVSTYWFISISFAFLNKHLWSSHYIILFTFLVFWLKTSHEVIACCIIIIIGYFLGVNQDLVSGSLLMSAVAYGVGGGMYLAFYTIFTKKYLLKVEGNIWSLLLYHNLSASLLLLPYILLFGEVPIIHALL